MRKESSIQDTLGRATGGSMVSATCGGSQGSLKEEWSHFEGLRWEDRLSQGVQDQPGQHSPKWNYIKLKSFCTEKDTINMLHRQPIEWEKIFVNYPSDKGLIPGINEELKELNRHKNK
ncbi:reverse transcriptase-like protein [Plecturocebus cupreus]